MFLSFFFFFFGPRFLLLSVSRVWEGEIKVRSPLLGLLLSLCIDLKCERNEREMRDFFKKRETFFAVAGEGEEERASRERRKSFFLFFSAFFSFLKTVAAASSRKRQKRTISEQKKEERGGRGFWIHSGKEDGFCKFPSDLVLYL